MIRNVENAIIVIYKRRRIEESLLHIEEVHTQMKNLIYLNVLKNIKIKRLIFKTLRCFSNELKEAFYFFSEIFSSGLLVTR